MKRKICASSEEQGSSKKLKTEPCIGEIFPFESDIFNFEQKRERKIPKWLVDIISTQSPEIPSIEQLLKELEMEEQANIEEGEPPGVSFGAGSSNTDNTKCDVQLKYIDITELSSRFNSKFRTRVKKFSIKLKNNIPKTKNNDVITSILNEIVNYAKARCNSETGDKINVVMQNPKFFHHISTGYSCSNHVTKLQEKVSQILTSDETIDIEKSIFDIFVVNFPKGSAGG